MEGWSHFHEVSSVSVARRHWAVNLSDFDVEHAPVAQQCLADGQQVPLVSEAE